MTAEKQSVEWMGNRERGAEGVKGGRGCILRSVCDLGFEMRPRQLTV